MGDIRMECRRGRIPNVRYPGRMLAGKIPDVRHPGGMLAGRISDVRYPGGMSENFHPGGMSDATCRKGLSACLREREPRGNL